MLVIEDEPMLLDSVVRGLNKLEEVEALGAPTLDRGLALVDERSPKLILSDLDLPGRSGLELIGELRRRGLHTPIVFVSAYVRAFLPEIPRHADIEILEKPATIDALRDVVLRRLGVPARETRSSFPPPFGFTEYLQLACMGGHSVSLTLARSGATIGKVIVKDGLVWSATDEYGEGRSAFGRLAFISDDVELRCRTLNVDAGERNIDGSCDALLLEAAQLHDEGRRSRFPPAMTDSEAAIFDVPAARVDPLGYQSLVEEGLDAMLAKDYRRAWEALTAARALRDDDPVVAANWQRLIELGGGPDASGKET